MASFKDTVTKGITTLNVKTNNFMEEAKCKTYISTLEEEIKKLKYQIGEVTYVGWSQGIDSKSGVESLLREISAKYQEIQLQKNKIENLSVEEQQILGNATSTQQQERNVGVIFCRQCGTQNVSTYKFCSKCGNQLGM